MKNFLSENFYWIIIVSTFIIAFYLVLSEEKIETKAIIITSGATVIYATLTYKLLDEQKKIIQKPRMQTIVDKIIVPLTEKIEIERNYLRDSNFRWGSKRSKKMYTGELTSNFSHSYGDKLTYHDFKDEFPDINSKIEKYSREVNGMKEKITHFADSIMKIPDFLEKVVEKWTEEYPSTKEDMNNVIELILRYTVNNEQKQEDTYTYYKFWNKYRDDFLIFRERKEVKGLKEEIETKSKELCYLLEEILRNLTRVLQEWRKKYGTIPKIREW